MNLSSSIGSKYELQIRNDWRQTITVAWVHYINSFSGDIFIVNQTYSSIGSFKNYIISLANELMVGIKFLKEWLHIPREYYSVPLETVTQAL